LDGVIRNIEVVITHGLLSSCAGQGQVGVLPSRSAEQHVRKQRLSGDAFKRVWQAIKRGLRRATLSVARRKLVDYWRRLEREERSDEPKLSPGGGAIDAPGAGADVTPGHQLPLS
jgi:hypothetical protein